MAIKPGAAVQPGKLINTPRAANARRSASPARESTRNGGEESSHSSARMAWEDFVEPRPVKKKEYFKGAGNRMRPPAAESKRGAELTVGADAVTNGELQLNVAGVSYNARVDYEVLEARIGYSFADRALLERALTHRSALAARERADYERLEFLGDAVLDLSVAHLLSEYHPEAREGELSKMRAALVNTQALADVAKRLEIGPFIRLGRGELSSGGFERPSILADVMEALIGAVYRDSSYEVALNLIQAIFGSALRDVLPSDPKTELQEALHASGSEPPTYLLEMVEGPEHSPTFVTVVIVDHEIAGRGRGTTKKAAQQEAAAQALARLKFSAPAPQLQPEQNAFIVSGLLVASTAGTEKTNSVESADSI